MSADHDVRTLLRRAADPAPAEPPAGEPDLAAIGTRRRRLTTRRRVAAGVAALLVLPLLGVAAAGLLRDAPLQLVSPPAEGGAFPLPDPGEVLTGWLSDDTPVFVLAEGTGEVHVVDPVVPYQPGLDVLAAWCPAAEAFVTPWIGAEFHADGRYASGPAPTDLATYTTTVEGGRVHVGDRSEPAGRSDSGQHPDTAPCYDEQDAGLDAVVEAARPVERLRTPEDAATQPAGSWQEIEGYVVTGPDGVRVCSDIEPGGLPFTSGAEPSAPQPRGPDAPPRCAGGGVPVTTGREPLPSVTVAEYGLLHALVADDGFARLQALTLEGVSVYDPARGARLRAEEETRAHLGAPGRVTVADGVVTVPAVDIDFPPPPAPLPAGTYTLRLANHGGIVHTLHSADLGVDLRADGLATDHTTVTLPPGEHRFVCTVPGHEQAGMALTLTVE